MPTINSVVLKRTGFSDLTLPFKYGITVKEVLNQDLDTGSLVLVKSNELDIEPFDIIKITYQTIKTLYFYVGTIQSKIIKFGTTKQYQYDIGLVSITTELQRIVLPSRSITQSLDGNNDYTIKEIMENYLEMYAPQFTLTNSLIQKLGTTKAPEQQWNRPTLFEVFNDLLKPLGSIVRVLYLSTNAKVIDFLDLDEEGSAIDETKIQNSEIRQDLTEYASEIEIDASNVYNKNAITHTPERYVAKTIDQALVTDLNQQIVLNKPIFDVEKVTCSFVYLNNSNILEDFTVDITHRVVNKKVWDTLTPTDQAGYVTDTATVKYQRNYLYFEEGKNVIELGFKEDDWWGWLTVDNRAIQNVIYHSLTDAGETSVRNSLATNQFNGSLYRKAVFNVEYLTTDNILFRVKKDNPTRNKSVLISSQESSIIDSENFGKQQQEFINRIGNREMTITGRYDNYDDIPNLKDYIDDFVLVEREIQIHESHYNFKGTMSEFYSKDNMFAGINSERKYFSVAQPDEAFISNHLTQVDLTISNNDESHTGWEHEIEKYVVENFGKKDKYIQGALVLTDETQTSTPSGQPKNELLLEVTPHAIGKSVILTMQMGDNYNSHFGLQRVNGRSLSKYIPYVDDNGRFEEIKIQLYRWDNAYANRGFVFKPYEINPNNFVSDATFTNQNLFNDATNDSARLPEIQYESSYTDENPPYASGGTGSPSTFTYDVINNNARVFTTGTSSNFYVKRYKDNREITHETIQFNFGTSVSGNGSTQEIFITNEFAKYTPFIFNRTTDYDFRIAYSTTLKYNRDSKTYKGTLMTSSLAEISVSGNELSIIDKSPSTTWSTVKNGIASYAICDASGNILIAVNKSGTYEPLYINR